MLPIQKKLIGINHSKGGLTQKYIVIHETANTRKGANAQAHYNYWNSDANAKSSSHFVVDDGNILQLVELTDRAWHVGDNQGRSDIANSNSIGIEICVNEDGDYAKARQNAIDLTRHLMDITGIAADQVVRHYDAWGKHCPANMMDQPELWVDFKQQLTTSVHWVERQGIITYLNSIGVELSDTRYDDPIKRGEAFALAAKLAAAITRHL